MGFLLDLSNVVLAHQKFVTDLKRVENLSVSFDIVMREFYAVLKLFKSVLILGSSEIWQDLVKEELFKLVRDRVLKLVCDRCIVEFIVSSEIDNLFHVGSPCYNYFYSFLRFGFYLGYLR